MRLLAGLASWVQSHGMYRRTVRRALLAALPLHAASIPALPEAVNSASTNLEILSPRPRAASDFSLLAAATPFLTLHHLDFERKYCLRHVQLGKATVSRGLVPLSRRF